MREALAFILGMALVSGPAFWYGMRVENARTRTATLQRSIEVIKQRNALDAKIRSLDDAGLCAALGGKWVQDQCE